MPVTARTPTCHPDRKHQAKGLCRSCYIAHLKSDPGYRALCNEKTKAWQRANPDKVKAYKYRRTRSHRRGEAYGITSKQYNEMLVFQHNACAICLEQFVQPCVDHDHETDSVRALLCSQCNSGLGFF